MAGETPHHVTATARDARELKQILHTSGDNPPMLSIEPIISSDEMNASYERDERIFVPGVRARPTDRFRVIWRGSNESFMREVTGLKELNEVLAPIFGEHFRGFKLAQKIKAKNQRLRIEERRKALESQIAQNERNSASLRQQIKELG